LENKQDILIIGAGILGLSCAYHLKKNNPKKEILVVDRLRDVAQGNTARSDAMFRNTFTSPDNQILADSSINFYLETQTSGFDLGLKKTGYLWVMSERQLSSNEKYVRKMEDNGIELRKFNESELKEKLPALRSRMDPSDEESKLMKLEDIAGAVLGVKCGQLDPDKLSRFYAQQFLKMGGKISLNTNAKSLVVEPVEPLGIEGEPFVWQDAEITGVNAEGELKGQLKAETVVVAAGVWNNEILEPIGIDGHVKGKKRQLFTLPAGQNAELRNFIHNRNFNDLGVLPFVILPKAGCYVKALAEENEFWVTCEDDFNRPFVNIPEPNLESCNAEPSYYEHNVYPILKGYLPLFADSRPTQMWAGLYSYNTLDSIPFVFEEPGMIVAGGGSGSGIMKGDAMGRMVDAMYRLGENSDATLYGGKSYPLRRVGFKSRQVQREEWVI
jgi:FAD-dependent oxidoreductase domain-containing protein 1